MKPKVKKKTLLKRPVPSSKKLTSKDESSSSKSVAKKAKVPTIKSKVTKNAGKVSSDESHDSDDDNDSHKNMEIDQKLSKKFKKPKARKAVVPTDVKEVVVRKRMASLNASAMMAATYEVERQLDKSEALYKHDKNSCSESDENIVVEPKKPKDIKDEVLESKDVCRKIFFFVSFKAVHN